MREGLLAAVALAVAALGPAAHAADWLRAESEHFVMTSDASEEQVRDYLGRLESLHQVASQLLGSGATQRDQPRFEIVALRGRRRLTVVRPEFKDFVAGAYIRCADGDLAFAGIEGSTRRGAPDLDLTVLQHEFVHHLTFRHARIGYPSWYIEGFAEFLATAFEQDGKLEIGRPDQGRLSSLRDDWLPFEQLLKPVSRGGYDDADEQARLSSFYAQAWLLTHYLLTDNDRTQRLNAYFERLAAGEDPVAAFEPALGVPVADMNRRLREHLRAFPVIRIGMQNRTPPVLRVQALPGSADDPVLEAAVLRTCPAPAHGQALLAGLRERQRQGQGRDTLTLKLALARAELLFGEPAAATALLQAVLADDDKQFEAQHLLGRAYGRAAQGLQGPARAEALAQARVHLFKAYRLQKNHAPNLYRMAELLAADGPGPNLLNAAQGARALAPGVPEYAFLEAQVDLDAGDRERAVRALMPLASDPHNPEFSARVRAAVSAIRSGQDKATVLGLLVAPKKNP